MDSRLGSPRGGLARLGLVGLLEPSGWQGPAGACVRQDRRRKKRRETDDSAVLRPTPGAKNSKPVRKQADFIIRK